MRFQKDDPELKDLHRQCHTVSFYVFTVLIAAALFALFLFNFKDVASILFTLLSTLTVILYGVFIACVLFPFFTLFRKLLSIPFKKRVRLCDTLALILTYVFLFAVLAVILLAVIPSFGDEVARFVEALQSAVKNANSLLSKNESLAFAKDIFNDIADTLIGKIITPNKVLSYVSDVLSGAYNIAIGTVISVYLLASRKTIGAIGSKVMLAIFPKTFFSRMIILFRSFYRGFMEFFFARLLLSALLALLSYLFCLLIGIPFRGIIMLILLFTGLIPFLGPILGTLLCFILVLLIDPSHALYLFAFIIIVYVLEGHFLKKRLLRPKLRPGAAVTSICVIIGYALFGFFGSILAVPVYASVTLNLRDFQIRHLLHRGYRIEDHQLVHHSEDDNQFTFMNDEE